MGIAVVVIDRQLEVDIIYKVLLHLTIVSCACIDTRGDIPTRFEFASSPSECYVIVNGRMMMILVDLVA